MEEEIAFSVVFGMDEFQSFAEHNFEREITDVELNRIREYLYECEAVFDLRQDLLQAAIEYALDNKGNKWKSVDEDYLKEKSKP